ncbi:MAG: DNA methyltransferase [Bacteroidota bacterium]
MTAATCDAEGRPLFTAVRNDCTLEAAQMEASSVDLIHTSIPFGTQYEYCESYHDFGHNDDNDGFFQQMDHLIPNLLRILKPGRIAAIHVKDRIRFGNVTGLGMPTVDRFSDKTADRFEAHGFAFVGRIVVTTDVVRENNQTYRLGWSEMCKDGTKMGVGMPEYVLLFRKLPTDTSTSYADEPIARSKEGYTRAQWQIDAHAHWRSSGNRLLRPEELASMSMDAVRSWYQQYSDANVYDYAEHVEMGRALEERGHLPASFMLFEPSSHLDSEHGGVWTDVSRMRTLNSQQTRKRQENHVCPLQLDIVERIIRRFSAEGELVYDPFGGLGTVPYVALQMGRRGAMTELNEEYFQMAVGYLRTAEAKRAMPTLFDAVPEASTAEAA